MAKNIESAHARPRKRNGKMIKPGFLISSHVDDFLSRLRKQRPLCNQWLEQRPESAVCLLYYLMFYSTRMSAYMSVNISLTARPIILQFSGKFRWVQKDYSSCCWVGGKNSIRNKISPLPDRYYALLRLLDKG